MRLLVVSRNPRETVFSLAPNFITIPNPPLISVQSGNRILTLNITPPSNNGGSDILGYIYAISTNGGRTFSSDSGIIVDYIFSIPELINGTSYVVRVNAVNSAGNSREITAIGIPMTIPNPPQITILSRNRRLVIHITPPEDNGGSAIIGYRYNISTNDAVAVAYSGFSEPISEIPIVIPELINDVLYSLRLVATNEVGDSQEVTDIGMPVSDSECNSAGCAILPEWGNTSSAIQVRVLL